MFRISKLSLSTKTNLELFRTVQNYNDHSIEVVDIINLTIICHQISRFMGRLSKKDSVYEDQLKKQGRQAGAKTYNKQTVFKLFSHLKTTNIVVQGTMTEQYRIACGELEAKRASVVLKKISRKCAILYVNPLDQGINDLNSSR